MKSKINFASDVSLAMSLRKLGFDVPIVRSGLSSRDREYYERLYAQQRVIKIVRDAWGVVKPDRDCLPAWVGHGQYASVLNDSAIFDHYGGVDGVLVAEPYFNHHRNDLVQRAEKHADTFGLNLKWSLMSWHYPGRTIRFEFTPRD